MGVSAVFVCSLALTQLPVPQTPPQTQPELLAASFEPIVSFVVLGSIIIRELTRLLHLRFSNGSLYLDGLSISFYSISKTTLSRTNTVVSLSASRSPDWLDAKSPASIECATETLRSSETVEVGPSRAGRILERFMAVMFQRPGDQPAAARNAAHSLLPK